LRHLQALGFRGFLIGQALMRTTNPEAALRDLIAGTELDTANDNPHQ
jgi:indole-3-glycerol phosphate synthase